MLRLVLRCIFVIIMVGIFISYGYSITLIKDDTPERLNFWLFFYVSIVLGLLTIAIEWFTPKKRLSSLAGVFFGILIGAIVSLAVSPLVDMFVGYYISIMDETGIAIKWIMSVCICFLSVAIVVRTKDDVRFVIPYIEFSKQTKGSRPLVLDTSVIIDGRIVDLCRNKFFDAALIVPRFVLNELQLISDSSDKLKRNKGRRGLDILKRMQESSNIDIEIDDTPVPDMQDVKGVDQKLIIFTKNCDGRLATTDYNLTKVALVREVDVLNINDLANSLKTTVLPGEGMEVKIIKAGEEADQGIGYLDDGTMIVVEGARDKIGKDIVIAVTSSLQTAAGKMIFGKFDSFSERNGNGNNRNSNSKSNGYTIKKR